MNDGLKKLGKVLLACGICLGLVALAVLAVHRLF
jgi:hypothetical protein